MENRERKLKEESMGEKEGACAFVAADGEGSVAVYWTSEASGHRALQGITDRMDRCVPGCSLFAAQRLYGVSCNATRLAGLDRGVWSSCDGGADLVRCVSGACPAAVAKLSLSGDNDPRCLPGSLRPCLSLGACAWSLS